MRSRGFKVKSLAGYLALLQPITYYMYDPKCTYSNCEIHCLVAELSDTDFLLLQWCCLCRLAFFRTAYSLYDADFYMKIDDDIYLRPGWFVFRLCHLSWILFFIQILVTTFRARSLPTLSNGAVFCKCPLHW